MTTEQKIDFLFKEKKEQGISARSILNELELSPTALSEWNRGKSHPTVETIIKLAKYFNVSTDYLLCLTDEPNTLSMNENTSTELIKRPKYAVSDKFIEDYMNLLNDKHFSNIAKVYNEFEDAYKIQIYTYIITLAAQAGLNVAKIVE